MFVCGVALLTGQGIAGVGTYLVGHGVTKAALFMCAGVLLHRFATIDEYDLHGRGREVPVVGVMMAIGALMLAALPPFTTFMGKSLLEESSSAVGYGWLIAVYIFVSAITAGAVLRATGRVFLGWGPSTGPHPGQARVAREVEPEEKGARRYTPPLMVVVPGVLLVGAFVLGLIPGAVPGIERQTARFVEHRAYSQWVLHGVRVQLPVLTSTHVSADDYVYSVTAVIGALLAAAAGLFGRPLRSRLPHLVTHPAESAAAVLHGLHSGHIGDYITWWTAGVSVVGGACLIALR
jgi:multicomponent Na+:H+ antiporter subunit D